jgi:hypothetical protein
LDVDGRQRKAGNDLLAISHNANLSDGRIDNRIRSEPLTEIKQIKGASEANDRRCRIEDCVDGSLDDRRD